MELLSRERMLESPALSVRDVPVPELGDGLCVRIRELTAEELEALMASAVDRNGKEGRAKPDFNRRLVQMATVDPTGARFFGEGEDGLKQIGRLSSRLVLRLAKAASELSGLNESDEALAKN